MDFDHLFLLLSKPSKPDTETLDLLTPIPHCPTPPAPSCRLVPTAHSVPRSQGEQSWHHSAPIGTPLSPQSLLAPVLPPAALVSAKVCPSLASGCQVGWGEVKVVPRAMPVKIKESEGRARTSKSGLEGETRRGSEVFLMENKQH